MNEKKNSIVEMATCPIFLTLFGGEIALKIY